MLELKDIKKIYFIGIGGIGMSALARYFRFHGAAVSGYDKTATVLTRQLESEGIPVHYEDDPEQAPHDVDLVVYTPAVPKDHKELLYYQQHKYTIMKRSEVLGLITHSSFNICVAGTHGKTTITTMIAHLLRHSGYGCNAFLGGIAVNYNSNFWSDERNVCVVEADEYDRSFLKLNPNIAVITAMDADHLDIYGTAGAVEQAFIDFSGKIKPGGLLLSKWGLRRTKDLKGDRHMTYSLRIGAADYRAMDIVIKDGSYRFRVVSRGWTLDNVVLNMGGLHNVENATAAIAVAHELGIDDDKIKAAVDDFRGVKRRFEYILRKDGLIFIDDYAHHPEELRALISGARELYPDMKCTVIFQPHLFTRTRDFADGFAESLDLADEVLLLPIYPARELPIEGVTSQLIADKMKTGKVEVVDKKELLDVIRNNVSGLVITAGAGDIDALIDPIREILDKK
ncbi:MAG: UDP-N-acetylmuramate--L-alanine ligase [Chitinophagaceae bacterium]|nr:UDP-N-acetylmuramate--L-alanine ligase [Chitinophagaceae bacterium]